jgi:Mn-dependent DtxR family transcriptional regulator
LEQLVSDSIEASDVVPHLNIGTQRITYLLERLEKAGLVVHAGTLGWILTPGGRIYLAERDLLQ